MHHNVAYALDKGQDSTTLDIALTDILADMASEIRGVPWQVQNRAGSTHHLQPQEAKYCGDYIAYAGGIHQWQDLYRYRQMLLRRRAHWQNDQGPDRLLESVENRLIVLRQEILLSKARITNASASVAPASCFFGKKSRKKSHAAARRSAAGY